MRVETTREAAVEAVNLVFLVEKTRESVIIVQEKKKPDDFFSNQRIQRIRYCPESKPNRSRRHLFSRLFNPLFLKTSINYSLS